MKTRIIILLSMVIFVGVSCNKEEPQEIKEFPETLNGTTWRGYEANYEEHTTIKFEDVVGTYDALGDSTIVYVFMYYDDRYFTRYEGKYFYPGMRLYTESTVVNGKLCNYKHVSFKGEVLNEDGGYRIVFNDRIGSDTWKYWKVSLLYLEI